MGTVQAGARIARGLAVTQPSPPVVRACCGNIGCLRARRDRLLRRLRLEDAAQDGDQGQ